MLACSNIALATLPQFFNFREKFVSRIYPRRLSSVLSAILLTGAIAAAQELTISGTVTDEKKAVVQGVTVVLRGPGGEPVRKTTEASGEYIFDGLKPGPYEISFSKEDYQSVTRTLILIDQPRSVDVVLGLGRATTSIEVTDSADVGAGSRLFVPDRQVPVMVSAVSQQTLREQNINDLLTALENVSGVTTQLQYGSMEWYTIGGVTQQSGNEFLLVDGMAVIGNRANSQLNNIERVEVIKGPSSIIYGSSSTSSGGQVNVVRKKPQAQPVGELLYRAGRWGLQEVGGGAAGTVFGYNRLMYRADIQVSSQDGWRQRAADRFNASPVVTWIPFDRLRLTLQQGFSRDRFSSDAGVPLALYNTTGFPMDRKLNPPGDFDLYRDWQTQVKMELRVTNRIQLQNFFATQKKRTNYLDAESMSYVAATNTVTRGNFYFDANLRPKQNQTVLLGQHRFLGMSHNWSAMYTFSDHFRFTYRTGATTNSSGGPAVPPLDIAAWLQPGFVDPATTYKTPLPISRKDYLVMQTNTVVLQDQISIRDRLFFNFVVSRFNWQRRQHNDPWNPATSTFVSRGPEVFGRDQDGVNYRAGVAYALLRNQSLMVYFNAASNFQPIVNPPATLPLDFDLLPQMTRARNIGVKWTTAGNRLTVNMELSKKTIFNLLQQIAPTEFEQVGRSGVKTADFDLEGNLGWGIRAVAVYGYAMARQEQNRTLAGVDFSGRMLQYSNKHSARAYLTKQWRVFGNKGITASLGATYRSKTAMNNPAPPTLQTFQGGWVRWDGGASFQSRNWSAAVNIANLFNRQRFWVSAINSGNQLYPGAPFAATFTLRYTFAPAN